MLDIDCEHKTTVTRDDGRYRDEPKRICNICGAELAPLAMIEHRTAKAWRRCVDSWIYIALLAHDDGDKACEKQHREAAAQALWNAALLEQIDQREHDRVRELRRRAHNTVRTFTPEQRSMVRNELSEAVIRSQSNDPLVRAWLVKIGLGECAYPGSWVERTEFGAHVLEVIRDLERLPEQQDL